MKKKLIKLSVAVAIMFISVNLSAQFGGGGTTPGGPGTGGFPTTGGGPVVPFDGGMSLMLVASGISYAAKKLRKPIQSI